MGFFSQPLRLFPVVESNHDIDDAVVVSDLHIGLPYFRKIAFVQFVNHSIVKLEELYMAILNLAKASMLRVKFKGN